MSIEGSCSCSLQAFEALIHLDAIICKAALVDEAKRLSEIERRLYEVSIAEFNKRAKKATAQLLASIRAGKAKDEDATLRLMSYFDKAFADLPKALAPFYTKAAEEAYRAGFDAIIKKGIGIYSRDRDISYPSPHRFPNVSDYAEREKAEPPPILASAMPSFSVVDERAIDTLKDHQVFWIGEHYGEKLSDTIANSVVDSMVKQGFDRDEGAKAVQAQLDKLLAPLPTSYSTEAIVPHGWSGSISQYYEGLAANTMTVSRTFGVMSGLRKLGATTYTVSNPVDDRTCDVCAFLNGTTFTVAEGGAMIDKVLRSKSPDVVKDTLRWDTLKTIQERSGVTSAGPGASAADAKALASNGYGLPPFHFRCRCVVDIGEDTSFGVPEVFDAPPESPVDPLRFKGDLSTFKIVTDVKPGGAHRKYLFEDPKGDQWLFKPYRAGEGYRAYGDVAAGRIAQAIGHETAELYITEYKGEIGSVQKWVKGVQGNFRTTNLATLDAKTLRAIQKEHAFDWLISNHDGHGGNLLKLSNEKTLGIDKGQLFKFFPKDKIHWTYNPNEGWGEKSIYNELLSKYSQGELGNLKLLTLRDKELREFFSAVERLDDTTYLNLVKIYSSERAKLRPDFNESKFLAEVLARKHNLTKDLQGIWKQAQKERDKILGVTQKVKPVPKAKGILTPINKEFIKEVEKSEWQGKSLLIGGDAIKDGQVLVYPLGDTSIIIEGKLSKYGDDIIRQFGAASIEQSPAYQSIADLKVEAEQLANNLLNKYPNGIVPTNEQMGVQLSVFKVINKGYDIEYKYFQKDDLKDFTAILKSWGSTEGRLNIDKLKVPIGTLKAESVGVTPEAMTLQPTNFPPISIKEGKIIADVEGVARTFTGISFDIEKGLSIDYIPHGVNTKIYSADGLFKIEIKKSIKNLEPEDLTKVFDKLAEHGLQLPLADKQQLEYHVIKSMFEQQYFTRTIVSDWSAPFESKFAAFKEAAKGIAKGKINLAPIFKYKGKYGKITWDRFDLSTKVKRAMKKKFVLKHNLFSGNSKNFLEKVAAKKTPALISTEEKYRIGLVPKGMSPEADQGTGGAKYAFARVRYAGRELRDMENGALYFSCDDAFTIHSHTYMNDEFGDIRPPVLVKAIKADVLPQVWGKLAHLAKDDETIIEGAIDLGKLVTVRVEPGEYGAAIAAMKEIESQGVKFSKPIEEIVSVIRY